MSDNSAESESPRYSIPDIEEWGDILPNMPDLAPVIIGTDKQGILRMRQLMLGTGASKASKTQIFCQLAVAVATGTKWLGQPCKKGRVLYLNLEVDNAEYDHRIKDISEALQKNGVNLSDLEKNLSILNLRGNSVLTAGTKVLTELVAEKIANKAALAGADDVFGYYTLIIIDPFYMAFNGDENNSGDVKRALGDFIQLVEATGAAVVYIHHHTKGASGGKDSIDRGAGSGVHGRQPDAIIDIMELDIGEKGFKAVKDRFGPYAVPLRVSLNIRGTHKPKPLDIIYAHPLHFVAPEELGLDKYKERGKDRQGQRKREQQEQEWQIRNKLAEDCLDKLGPDVDRPTLFEAMCENFEMPTYETFKTWFKNPRFNYRNSKEEDEKGKTCYYVRPRDDSQ